MGISFLINIGGTLIYEGRQRHHEFISERKIMQDRDLNGILPSGNDNDEVRD